MSGGAGRGRHSILHLGKFYPPHSGGMETHLRDLAVRQTVRAHVSVVVANAARRHEQALMERVNVTRVGRLTTIASMPVCPGLTAAIRDSPADLVHLHAPNPGAAFAPERRLASRRAWPLRGKLASIQARAGARQRLSSLLPAEC